MVEKAEVKSGLHIQVKAWEPFPGHAVIIVGNNGTYKGEIIFSNTGGFGSGAQLLDDPEVSFAVAENLTIKVLGAEEDKLVQALKSLKGAQDEEILNKLRELREPRRRALYRNALVHLGVDIVNERR